MAKLEGGLVSQNMIRLTCRIRVCAAQGQFAELSERKDHIFGDTSSLIPC